MVSHKPINLFYSEPDRDRWIRFDRYPRKLVRRIIRGPERFGGVQTVAVNLMAGLKKLNIPFRFNDYHFIKENPDELACIIGKSHLLFEKKWRNPILFGAGIYSHPVECINLFEDYPQVKHVLVPGEWMRKMFEPYYGSKVSAWPTGIDTEKWKPTITKRKYDFLIYNKIRWEYAHHEEELINPLKNALIKRGLTFHEIKYGTYELTELQEKLGISKAAIFLCEHETQGIAYQQILSTNTPILAWDRGGFWQDPSYYPNIKFQEVSSVPYWDESCGTKFKNMSDLETSLSAFLIRLQNNSFSPRRYIQAHLSLEKCAAEYLKVVQKIVCKPFDSF